MHKLLAAFLALFLMQAVCPAKDPPQITDDTISDAVRVKLAGDQLVGVLNFDVTVKQGVVTLARILETPVKPVSNSSFSGILEITISPVDKAALLARYGRPISPLVIPLKE